MPGLYPEGEFDLAGCMIGTVLEERVVDGARVHAGDRALALPSVGLHTNGYSLARRVLLEQAGLRLDDELPGAGVRVADALLAPHRSYTAAVLPLVEAGLVTGMAHITGGGLPGNVVRVLPEGIAARLDRSSWTVPPLFRAIEKLGKVPAEDLARTFNLGVGFVLFARDGDASRVVEMLRAAGEAPWILGEAVAGERAVEWV
jgi:phosphoribosylformylglycinamidine cyclo-ligase